MQKTSYGEFLHLLIFCGKPLFIEITQKDIIILFFSALKSVEDATEIFVKLHDILHIKIDIDKVEVMNDIAAIMR